MMGDGDATQLLNLPAMQRQRLEAEPYAPAPTSQYSSRFADLAFEAALRRIVEKLAAERSGQ
jgi:hypothetical protein